MTVTFNKNLSSLQLPRIANPGVVEAFIEHYKKINPDQYVTEDLKIIPRDQLHLYPEIDPGRITLPSQGGGSNDADSFSSTLREMLRDLQTAVEQLQRKVFTSSEPSVAELVSEPDPNLPEFLGP